MGGLRIIWSSDSHLLLLHHFYIFRRRGGLFARNVFELFTVDVPGLCLLEFLFLQLLSGFGLPLFLRHSLHHNFELFLVHLLCRLSIFTDAL